MIIVIAAVLGAAYGSILARRRKGKTMDMVQYGVGFAIAYGLVGLLATVILDRVF